MALPCTELYYFQVSTKIWLWACHVSQKCHAWIQCMAVILWAAHWAGRNPVSRPHAESDTTPLPLLAEDDRDFDFRPIKSLPSAPPMPAHPTAHCQGRENIFYFKMVSNNLKGKTIQGDVHLENIDLIVQQYDFISESHHDKRRRNLPAGTFVQPKTGSLLALSWSLGLVG